MQAPRDILKELFDAALAAADPYAATLNALPGAAKGRNLVIGAGKAAARMAQAVEERYGDRAEGFVVVPKGYAAPLNHIQIIEASHPVPDDAGQAAAKEALSLANGLGEGDRLLALISGGGSALMAAPADGITLADKQRLTSELLKSGAAIWEINIIRKHLSAIKGGRLAQAAHPAPVETYIVSDIPGDDLAMVASGPTLGDRTSNADALAVLAKYAIAPGDAVRAHLNDSAKGTPDPGDACFEGARVVQVAGAAAALAAAAERAVALGLRPILLGDALEGAARDVAADHARRAVETAAARSEGPVVLLSGGETSVTLQGKESGQCQGQGGRNTEYALALALALAPDGGEALALALEGGAGIYALACDTDGVDGTAMAGGDAAAAGAIVTPTTLTRAREKGIDPAALLARHDSASLFAALGDLVVTGPTLTNVSDFRAIIIGV